MSNGKKALPYEVIMSAISGDAESVNYVWNIMILHK